MGNLSRVVSVLSMAALLSGCAIKRQQRQVATYAAAGVGLVGVGLYFQAALSDCPPNPGTGIDVCEEDRHDRKNLGGIIALGGLAAAIIAQLWPVTGAPERPPISPKIVEPMPPPTAEANTLRDPAAVQLAANARAFAAEGRCLEAFGSLRALRQLDAPLADQLQAWDPMVTRCRVATTNSPTALEVAKPSGPPSQTTPPSLGN